VRWIPLIFKSGRSFPRPTLTKVIISSTALNPFTNSVSVSGFGIDEERKRVLERVDRFAKMWITSLVEGGSFNDFED
jgi:hypothetical protein